MLQKYKLIHKIVRFNQIINIDDLSKLIKIQDFIGVSRALIGNRIQMGWISLFCNGEIFARIFRYEIQFVHH